MASSKRKPAASARSQFEVEEDNYPPEDSMYMWEKEYEKTWEAVHEDEGGRLRDDSVQQTRPQAITTDLGSVRRGIIRHLVLVIDFSLSIKLQDVKPSRQGLILSCVKEFITEYFDQNPISQLSLVITRNGVAEVLTDLAGNPANHIQKLAEHPTAEGSPSLQNALTSARTLLKNVPKYGSREVVVIYNALTTCDPGSIFSVIDQLKKEDVVCSIIGFGGEMRVCKHIADRTFGTYGVVLDETHFRTQLFAHSTPRAVTTNMSIKVALVKMGFPERSEESMPSFCACHTKLTTAGYKCPRCLAKVCELPCDCPVCGLTLIASPHLARSYHHLFPVAPYTEIQTADKIDEAFLHCFACGKLLSGSGMECPRCKRMFCFDCDVFAHETLHNCPGCEMFLYRDSNTRVASYPQ